MLVESTVISFLDETASSSPAPGGGTISALAASLSAALTSMVCRLTIGKKKYADVEETMKDVLDKSETIRIEMQACIDNDTAAFQAVMDAFSLPKESEEQKQERSDAIQAATKGATDVPLELVRACSRFSDLIQIVASDGNKNSLSDVGVAALSLSAAVRGAAMNVYINLGGLKDEAYVSDVRAECKTLEKEVSEKCETIARTIRDGLLA